jgi:hypothetical protein
MGLSCRWRMRTASGGCWQATARCAHNPRNPSLLIEGDSRRAGACIAPLPSLFNTTDQQYRQYPHHLCQIRWSTVSRSLLIYP